MKKWSHKANKCHSGLALSLEGRSEESETKNLRCLGDRCRPGDSSPMAQNDKDARGHDRERPSLPVIPASFQRESILRGNPGGRMTGRERLLDARLPLSGLTEKEAVPSVLPTTERKTVFLLFPTLFGHYSPNDILREGGGRTS